MGSALADWYAHLGKVAGYYLRSTTPRHLKVIGICADLVSAKRRQLGGCSTTPLARGSREADSGDRCADDVREAKFHMDRVRRLSLLSQQHMYFIIGEHQEILERLKSHDVDGADASMAVHLISVMRELDLIRENHPEYFLREANRGR